MNRPRYTPPARDSAAALANTRMFLTNARSLDGWTPQRLATQYRLSLKVAEYELTMALRRRAARGE